MKKAGLLYGLACFLAVFTVEVFGSQENNTQLFSVRSVAEGQENRPVTQRGLEKREEGERGGGGGGGKGRRP